jgi:DNA-damage-inducible protein J
MTIGARVFAEAMGGKFRKNVAMKNEVIRARIDSELKANAARVLAACGLEPSDAIRLFLQQVVAHQGLTFEVRAADREPSMAQLQELKRKPGHCIGNLVIRGKFAKVRSTTLAAKSPMCMRRFPT